MYQVLYRKYRPKIFADVYGQDNITSTLKNEIKENRISHAYLFVGSRGTGKTTCAKIMAKAVNCQSTTDGEPCNECEVCKGLDDGSIFDVVEIDAASNNGVDNIRDLRDEVNYTPTKGKYRVYIIDEVHMLSTAAFNALLKTLEEPPSHVIFILATTEVHKLPATILSRCQRFDFKRIQPETMAVRIKQVSQLEGFTIDDESALLISKLADGALRDGLSILDQCAGRSTTIDVDLVYDVAGLAGREALYKLSNCVVNNDSEQAMSIISELYQNSYDMERLATEMLNHYRNFLIAKTVKKSRDLVICTDDEYNNIVECAKNFTIENIIFAIDMFQKTLVSIKSGANARVEIEMAFAKLCQPKLDTSVDALLDRISKLERMIKNGVATGVKYTQVQQPVNREINSQKAVETPTKETPIVEPQQIENDNNNQVVKQEVTVNIPPISDEVSVNQQESPVQNPPLNQEQVEFEDWNEFLDVLRKSDMAMFGVLMGSKGFTRGEYFLIDSTNATVREFIKIPVHSKAIRKALYDVTGIKYKLGLFKQKSAQTEKRDPLEDLINQAQGSVDIQIK